MNEYLGQQALARAISPYRVAYVYPDQDRRAFELAVQTASARWAGNTEPIVPMGSNGDVLDADLHIVELANVDCIVSVGADIDRCREIAAKEALDCTELEDLRADRGPFPLRNWPWNPVERRPAVAARAAGELWEKVAAGIATTPEPPRVGVTEDHSGRAQFTGDTLLDRNRADLYEYWASGFSGGPVLLWVTDGKSLQDCNYYWNVRALQPKRFGDAPMFLLPMRAFDAWIDLKDQILGAVGNRRYAGQPHVVISSFSIDETDLAQIGTSLGLTHDKTGIVTFKRIHGPRDPAEGPPHTFAIGIDPRHWVLQERGLGHRSSSQVQLFRNETPVPVGVQGIAETVEISPLAPLRLRFQAEFLDDLPRRASVAQAVHRDAQWKRGEFAMLVGNSPDGELRINVPSSAEVLVCLTREAGANAKPSDKGKLAAGLLTARNCEVFTDTDALATVRGLTTPRSAQLAKKLSEFGIAADQQRAAVEWLASVGGRSTRRYASADQVQATNVKADQLSAALETLASAGWLERGIGTECERCGVPTFLEFRDVPRSVVCPGCGAPSPLAGNHGQVRVQYRLDSYLDRCSDQGVVAHVAVATALAKVKSFLGLHLGMDVVLPNGSPQEVDIFGFVGRAVIAGEVKTSSTEFTPDQIRRDIALSSALGADHHVLGCAEPLDEQLVAAVRAQCAAEGLGLAVVSPKTGTTTIVADLASVEFGADIGPRPW